MQSLSEESYVGMTQCYFCNKDKDILLDTRLRNRFPRYVGVVDMEPCNDCIELMKQGIMLICISDCTTNEEMKKSMPNPHRTGQMVVVRDEFISRLISSPELVESIIKKRFCFLSETIWKLLRLPKGERK